MPDYNALAQTALNLLGSFGQDVTLVQVTAGTFAPSTNTFSGASTTNTTVKGARLNYHKSQVDGEVIKQGDVRLFIDAVNVATAPTVEDKIKFGSDEWSIQDVTPLQPAGVPVIYDLQLRQ